MSPLFWVFPQSPWVPERTGPMGSIFMTREPDYSQGKEWHSLAGHTISQVRIITLLWWGWPWSRSNHHMGTRLLQLLWRTRTEIMINQATICLRLLYYAYLSPPAPVFPLSKPKGHICTLMMGWNAYFASSCGVPVLYNKSPFSDLLNYSSLYLVFWSKWTDLTCWNLWSWASGL
jgi:hypothetical protein